jgi:two-component system, OmpR family, response regulator
MALAGVGPFLRQNARPSGSTAQRYPLPSNGGPAREINSAPAVHLQAYVIEDNATIRENLVGALEELTCVKVAGSSATESEALDWLEQHAGDWDLLIVDLFLKQGSGIHLAQVVKRQRPSQKVVVFSNYVNSSVRKRCAQLGVDAVFDKSTEIDSLVDYCANQ